ncbi:Asp23/Gls24 family envelope stress response protein [Terrabacter sp. BE26]|uniref:Asp23/Gls24 family envelope stress response protein n=1 Tax=Terrabacter sp. BE26 TaxID=2898152 RepID=UPI0035BE75EC
MTDVATASAAQPPASSGGPPGGLPDPAERGRLDVADRVVERVAGIAACEVSGVRPLGSGLDGVVGRQYPKVKAEVAGGHARVQLDIAVDWPVPLASTAAQVRDHVRDRLTSLVGLAVDAVDVTIATIAPAAASEHRRVQ